MWRRQRGRWLAQVKWTDASVNTGDGTTNELRVTTVGGNATFYLNGTRFQTLTGTPPEKGQQIADTHPRSMNFAIWWDGDLLRELLDGNRIMKWDWKTATDSVLLTADGCLGNNGSKNTPALSADILGDWREEVVLRTADSTALRVYSTPIPSDYGFITLMQDPQYRAAIAWQNTAYNQPPHTGFFLGAGMKAPPKRNIVPVGG